MMKILPLLSAVLIAGTQYSKIKTERSDCVEVKEESRIVFYCDYRKNGPGLDEVQIEEWSPSGRVRETIYLRDKSFMEFKQDNDGVHHIYATIPRDSPKAKEERVLYAAAKKKAS